MKKTFFFLAWMVALMALAVPAKRVKRTIVLNDGTRREVVLRGDEHQHFFEDADGEVFVEHADGGYVRAEKAALVARWQKRLAGRNAALARRATNQRRAWGDKANPISGKRQGLVILVDFTDVKLRAKHDNAYYKEFFNQEGFSRDGMAGSVHDFFLESSYGQFDLTFDIVGPVTLSQTMSYYGGNDAYGNDKHPCQMVIEACRLADEQGVDFSKYDWDGDGYVDQVFLVYGGYAESAGASDNTIWPHSWELSSGLESQDGTGPLAVDGVTVDTYAMTSELSGTTGDVADGIGTACHEFSHCMCLPDLYDTSGASVPAFGMGEWDLMDYGCYSGPEQRGECPTGYSSYERMYCGWLTPTELNQPCEVSGLKDVTQSPEAYILYNTGNPNEFYMLENRQQHGFHRYDPARGLLILHVDFDKKAWMENTVNNVKTHQRVTLIPADNTLTSGSLEGDLWPGPGGRNALTDTSTPAAKLFSANADGRRYMGKPIENIVQQDGLVGFRFDGGTPLPQLARVEEAQAVQLTPNGFTAQWKAVEGATSYEVELTEKSVSGGTADVRESVLLDEDFANFNNGKTNDGTTDLSDRLDDYTHQSGWSGAKLYTTPAQEVKMGSSKAMGRLYAPYQEPSQTDLTLVVEARAYGGKDESKLSFGYSYEGMDGESVSVKEVTLGQSEQFYVVHLTNLTGRCTPCLTSRSRAYISRFVVLDGYFDEEEALSLFEEPTNSRSKATRKTLMTTTDTRCEFTNLRQENTYSFRVRALAEGYQAGEWTEALSVDLVTSIGELPAEDVRPQGEMLHDLQGRRLDTLPQRGVYIRNGKKVVVR